MSNVLLTTTQPHTELQAAGHSPNQPQIWMRWSVVTKRARLVPILPLAAVSLPQHQQLMQLLSSSFDSRVGPDGWSHPEKVDIQQQQQY